MYNRYIRNEQGSYTRIQEEDAPPFRQSGPEHFPPKTPPPPEPPQTPPCPPRRGEDLLPQTLRKLLDRFHLEQIDTGDLLLILLLLFLLREDADEELLFALGLLLIL